MTQEAKDMLKTRIIRPGVIVMLTTSVNDAIKRYGRDVDVPEEILEMAETQYENAIVKGRENFTLVKDPEEHKRAQALRSRCRNMIVRCCTHTPFGLMCPNTPAQRMKLYEAHRDALAMIREFNVSARYARISLFMLTGEVKDTDSAQVQAMAGAMRILLDDLQQGVAEVDVDKVRKVARKATEMRAMMADEQSARVGEAIKAARKAANYIAAQIRDGAEKAQIAIERESLRALESARMAYLEYAGDNAGDVMPVQMSGQRFGQLDTDAAITPEEPEPEYEPEPTPVPVVAPRPPMPALDFGDEDEDEGDDPAPAPAKPSRALNIPGGNDDPVLARAMAFLYGNERQG